jgi:hypothetical protein
VNIQSSNRYAKTAPPRMPQRLSPEAQEYLESRVPRYVDTLEPYRPGWKDHLFEGVSSALPCVGGFAHLRMIQNSKDDPTVTRLGWVGYGASLLGGVALFAHIIKPSPALLLSAVAGCSLSGLAGMAASVSMPAGT